MSKRTKRTPRRKRKQQAETGIHASAQTEQLDALRIEGASGQLELLEAGPDDGAAALKRFSMVAYTGVPISVGFGQRVVVDLAGMSIPSQSNPVFRAHDHDLIIGHTDSVAKTQQRLSVTGVISGVGDAAAEVISLAKNGFPWQASIGASVETMEFVEAGDTAKVNGRVWHGPLNVARETTLGEVSFVPLGADQNTRSKVAARKQEKQMDEKFVEWLKAKGFDPDGLTELQATSLEAAWKAESAPPKPQAPSNPPPASTPAPNQPSEPKPQRSLEQIMAGHRAEQERQNVITRMTNDAVRENPDMIDELELMGRTALEDRETTVDKYELALLRACRARVQPAIHTRRPGDVVPDDSRVIEAAVCRQGRLADIEKHFDAKTLEASERYWKHGLGLGELILTFARRNGYRGLNVGGDVGAALRAAFDIRAAGSTSPSLHSLSGVLSNTANKFLKMGFDAVENVWRSIAAIRNVNDFKTITSYSLSGDMTYQELGPGGEIKHGEMDATSYTNKADTYARMFALDRRDLINDDLGALTRTGFRLGRGGATKLNLVFWTEFLDNSTFFAAGNNNVSTGALSLANLEALHTVFRRQTDPDGHPIGLAAKILLVPPAINATAWNIVNGIEVQSGSTTTVPNANMFAGMFSVESSTYMQDSSLTGNSSTAYYLLADPMDMPVIEVVFLNGVEQPTVETADADFGTLGIAFRGYHDFGANKQEYRGGARSTGA